MEEGYQHDDDHRNHHNPVERTGDEEDGAEYLNKDDEQQRNFTADMCRVGKYETELGIVVHLLLTVQHQHQSEEKSEAQQQEREAFGVGGLGKKKIFHMHFIFMPKTSQLAKSSTKNLMFLLKKWDFRK